MNADVQVIDARDIFIQWNKNRLDYFIDENSQEYKYVKLIPAFLQLNNRLLPGYSGFDAPVGVYGYEIDKVSVNEIKKLNNKFRYQSEGVIRNSAVDAVFFQRKTIDASLLCWVFCNSSLAAEKFSLLKNKIQKISQWFLSKNTNIEFICITDKTFSGNSNNKLLPNSKAQFLDEFYSETILLAGKYPAWWLVPLSKEKEYSSCIEYIKQARFVDNDEFFDLGNLLDVNRDDLVRASLYHVQENRQSPEIALVQLIILSEKNEQWPGPEGISIRLKKSLLQREAEASSVKIVSGMLHESFLKENKNKRNQLSRKIFMGFKKNPGKLNPEVIDAFLENEIYKNIPFRLEKLTGLDNILDSIAHFKSVSEKISCYFFKITNFYVQSYSKPTGDQGLYAAVNNTRNLLSENASRIPLYNSKDMAENVFERIILRYNNVSFSEKTTSIWSLVLETVQGGEKVIDGFNSLLGLLAWCWLNRVVNHLTQISIDYPTHKIKQVDARHILEILMQNIDPKILMTTSPGDIEKPARPLKSFLFVNSIKNAGGALQNSEIDEVADSDEVANELVNDLEITAEQILINSWGDVYTQKYSGNAGILQCLCKWTHHAPLDLPDNVRQPPQAFRVFSCSAGDSNFLAQRIEQIYTEIIAFFYKRKRSGGRFILNMDSIYYLISENSALLQVSAVGGRKSLLSLLESPLQSYRDTAFERLAFTEQPLHEIYKKNKINTVQVFFQRLAQQYHIWVLDELGSLWVDRIDTYAYEAYVNHWLYLFSNIRDKFKKLNPQKADSISLKLIQVSANQLGVIEFKEVGHDSLTGEKAFIDLQLAITQSANGDQLNLSCDTHDFSYDDYKQDVMKDCVQYLNKKIQQGSRPVFVTDINISLELYNVVSWESVQTVHMLKFKRNFERRINKMLEG